MNDFAKWKYILVAVVVLFGLLYATPILYPPQLAVQMSANRGATVDEALKEKVLGILQTKKIQFDGVELNGDRIARAFSEYRCAARRLRCVEDGSGRSIRRRIESGFDGAGMDEAIGANRMPLGLDLQGGVHFLMEVDSKAALTKMQQRYVDDIRAALRNANIRYESVNPRRARHRCHAAFRRRSQASRQRHRERCESAGKTRRSTAAGIERRRRGQRIVSARRENPRCDASSRSQSTSSAQLDDIAQSHEPTRRDRTADPTAGRPIALSSNCRACRTRPKQRKFSARSPRSNITPSTKRLRAARQSGR